MSEKALNQASSKEDLDQLSALEESVASFGLGDLDSEQGVILKDWSAQDFANIYVRFRPHLISHARKFLREETQAEEVVQDAFLYLMTALPELDSELGVLRFLKWKTKMLCLDIIRSSQSGLNNNLVPLPDDVADESQPLDSLERADDAAIIRLALAKLNPRHREALLATMYEEKSHEEVARQMGVGENAFRQLLFRARSSFRKALVGEAEVEGKSTSEILAVASRKAIRKSASLGIPLLLIVYGATGIGNFIQPTSVAIGESGAEIEISSGAKERHSELAPQQPLTEFDAQPSENALTSEEDVGRVSGELNAATSNDLDVSSSPVDRGKMSEELNAAAVETQETYEERELRNLLGPSLVERISQGVFEVTEAYLSNSLLTLSLTGEDSISGSFGLQVNDSKDVRPQFAWLTLTSNGHELGLAPRSIAIVGESQTDLACTQILYSDFIAGDTKGSAGDIAIADTTLGQNGALLEVCIDETGQLINSTLKFSNKT